MVQVTTIFVMPTMEGVPPRAVLGFQEVEDPEEQEPQEYSVQQALDEGQKMATFSNDIGCWTVDGVPLPEEFSDAISRHAHDLGVPGF